MNIFQIFFSLLRIYPQCEAEEKKEFSELWNSLNMLLKVRSRAWVEVTWNFRTRANFYPHLNERCRSGWTMWNCLWKLKSSSMVRQTLYLIKHNHHTKWKQISRDRNTMTLVIWTVQLGFENWEKVEKVFSHFFPDCFPTIGWRNQSFRRTQ